MPDSKLPHEGKRGNPPPKERTGEQTVPRMPARLGRFEIRQVLGEGAFGRVYLAFDPELGRQVAIKVPHRDGLTPAFRDRFVREARATATIHHPNVCPVYDVGTDGDLPFIVMHYVVGGTLAGLLAQPLTPRQAVTISRKLALGMAAAHAQGVVHRDLKLQNVLFDKANREVLITDFGLARLEGQSRATADGAVFGTPAYMSPEQARGLQASVGPLSDVYSLGVILYHLLTGDVPFRGSVYEVLVQHWETPPRPPSTVRAGLNAELDAICLKAMAKAPADRYPTAKAFARALGDYLRVEGQPDAANLELTDEQASLRTTQPAPKETVKPRTTHATPPPLPTPAERKRPSPPPVRTEPHASKPKPAPARRPKPLRTPEPEELPLAEPMPRSFGKIILAAVALLGVVGVGLGIVLKDWNSKPDEHTATPSFMTDLAEKEKVKEPEKEKPAPPPKEPLKSPILTIDLPKTDPPKPPVPKPTPPPPKVEPPRLPAAEVKAFEREMYLPPFRPFGGDTGLADFSFTADALKDYAADVPFEAVLKDKEKYKLRVAVVDALNEIRNEWSPRRGATKLRAEVKEPLSAVKNPVKKEQEFWAIGIADLELRLAKLNAVAGLRAAERKRWQANYDFALASVKARLVYMNEYNKVLGNLTTETLPALNAKKGENGYTLTPSETLKSGKDIKLMAEEAHALFDEIVVNYKGTPWAALAERDKKVSLGFAWKAAVVK